MIFAPRRVRVQVGQQIAVPFDTDLGGDVTWGLHSTNAVTWLAFADPKRGEATGTAVADGGGRFVVTATSGTESELYAVLVYIVPGGFQAHFDPVIAPVGEDILAVPRLWAATQPVRWYPTRLPVGLAVGPATGVVTGSMPATGQMVHMLGRDAAGALTAAALQLVPTSAQAFEVSYEGTRTRRLGQLEFDVVAGETLAARLETAGAVAPLAATLAAGPPWTRITDGDAVVLGGTPEAAQGGYVRVDVTDSRGWTGRFEGWIRVVGVREFKLDVPARIEGPFGADLPADTHAVVVGGVAPVTLAVEEGPNDLKIDSATRLITGKFPPSVGIDYVALFSATDANGERSEAEMTISAAAAEFDIVLADLNFATGEVVKITPTVTAGKVAQRWSKVSGPAWITVNGSTGELTGTAPATSSLSRLTLFSESTTGDEVRKTVDVVVTAGTLSCSIPAVAAQRGTAGSVAVGVTNAPGGSDLTLVSGPPWATLSGGRIRWGALGATDTSVVPIVVRVTRRGDNATATCQVTPTIADAGVITCTITGPDRLQVNASAIYTVSTTDGTPSRYALGATGATVTALGGGRFRVANTTAAAGTATLNGRVVVGGVTSAQCTKSVASVARLACTVPSPTFRVGGTISGTVTATGGSGSGYRYTSLGLIDLPPGITLNATTGVLSGGSTAPIGRHLIVVLATDSDNHAVTCSGTITVLPPAPVCAATPALSGSTGATFSGQLPQPTNAAARRLVRYAKASGPAWLAVNPDGSYRGTYPTEPYTGTWSYTITAQGGTCTGSASAIDVYYPALTCSMYSPTSGFVGETLSVIVELFGGTGSYISIELVSPAPGLSISGRVVTLAAQTLTHTVTATVRVTDSAGSTTTCSGTFTVSGERS